MAQQLLSADHRWLSTNAGRSAAWGPVASQRDPALAGVRGEMLRLLTAQPDALVRTARPGHFTGSALVFDSTGDHVLLLFHTKLQRWLQPGGHADGDGNLAAVALREAHEETAIDGLRIAPSPVDLDIHEVDPPAEDPHLHLDVRFLVVAPPGAVGVSNHESQDMRWVAFADLGDYDLDDGTVRMIERGRARFVTT